MSLDTQAVVDLPWVQARLGAGFTPHRGVVDRRLHLGAFIPPVQPLSWIEIGGDVWGPPE